MAATESAVARVAGEFLAVRRCRVLGKTLNASESAV
jgi:hypothetical protein